MLDNKDKSITEHPSYTEERNSILGNSCIDTSFTIHGDNECVITGSHDFMKDTWILETSIKGTANSLLTFESKNDVLSYLVTKEETLLPAIGVIYDDLLYVLNQKLVGVFDASTHIISTVSPSDGVTVDKLLSDSKVDTVTK